MAQKHTIICDVCGLEFEAADENNLSGKLRISHRCQQWRPASMTSEVILEYDICRKCLNSIDAAGGIEVVVRRGKAGGNHD